MNDEIIANKDLTALFPRSGLSFAAVQHEGVLLDLNADRYWGLDGPGATIWQGLIDGLTAVPISLPGLYKHMIFR